MANKWFETVAEAQRRAKKRLPKSVYGALIAGSERGLTLEDNITAYSELGFAPHVAGLAQSRDLTTKVMGQEISFPVLISPTGVQAVHPGGEVAMAAAAAARGTAMGLSSFASMPVEDVVAANPQTFFQIYWIGTRDQIAERVERARAAGAVGLIATSDWSFSHGRDWGSPTIPETVDLKAMLRFAPEALAHPALAALVHPHREVPRPDDAEHGGQGPDRADVLRRLRRMDGDAAAELGRRGLAARAVGRRLHAEGRRPGRRRQASRRRRRQRHFGVEPRRQQSRRHSGHHPHPPRGGRRRRREIDVLLDGGIRRGGDAVKALALGAKAVMIGRASLWGLAANGQAGVENVLDIMRSGIESALLGLGHASIHDLSPDDLVIPEGFSRHLG